MADGPMRITQPLINVLEALIAADDQELHGWAIMKQTQRSGPTVYRLLEKLAAAEWVTWRWEEQTDDAPGPRRRFYRLTPNGTQRARAILDARTSPRTRRLQIAFGSGAL